MKLVPAASSDPNGIKNYVYMMMENRTYDHYFGASMLEGKPGNGLQMTMTNPDTNGDPVSLYVPSATDPSEWCSIPHSWGGAPRLEWTA